MSTAEVRAWSREANRLGNQIEHRKKSVTDLLELIKKLEAERDELIEKIMEAGRAEQD